MQESDLREITTMIVAAYVGNNAVARADLPEVVKSVAGALSGLSEPKAPEQQPLVPPVSVKKSITPDYLISMEDGKQYKSLKRHLAVRGLTPEEYRQKWGLPADYPMVAANYAAARSALAKSMGLGRKPAEKPIERPRRVRKAK